ncbi:MAG: DedA family protein [Myxococcales bacterium]|nr:DedA family protein [Myxococcales bacterium]
MDGVFGQIWERLATVDITSVWAFCFGILLLCGFGLPVPEDITLVTMGYMTHRLVDGVPGADGRVSVAIAVAIGMAGVLIGDACMFTLGSKLGGRLLTRWPFRTLFGKGRLERATTFLQEHGPKVLFSARFMPGLRSVVFFTSGTLQVRLRTFLWYDGLAALLSVPALVLSSWYWGAQIDVVIAKAQAAEHGIVAVIGLVVLAVVAKSWWSERKRRRDEAARVVPPT